MVALHCVGAELQTLDCSEERLVDLLAYDLDLRLVALEADMLHSLDAVDMIDDIYVVGSDDLRSVLPVGLVAVVFLGIVGGRDIHAALASEMAYGERQLRSGAERVEQIHLYAVGRENVGHDLGKEARIVAHVMPHGHLDLRQILEILLEIVGESLCGGANGVDVHAVAAGAHDAAQSAGAEFKIAVEGVDQFGLVVGLKHAFHFLSGGFVISLAKPHLCLGFNLLEQFGIFHTYSVFG